ncbi:MAG: hypothetical protein QNJ45_08875 [Ardenticatenaceae bacterium]|nr:hypothetical protein [Ardenticatenaceae bacterium]
MELINVAQIALGSLIRGAPVYIVQIVGIIVAAQNLGNFPRRSRLALSGLLVALINGFISSVLLSVFPILAVSRDLGAANLGIALTALGIFFAIIAAVGWGLVIMAVFASEKGTGG